MGDGGAERSLAVGDSISLIPDIDGTHVLIFASSKLALLCVGYLLYLFCYSNCFSLGHQEFFKESS